MNLWKTVIMVLWVFCADAQNTFHKIYFFDDSIAVIQNVYPTDTCYFFSGFIANKTTNRYESTFGKLSLNGDMEYFVNNVDLSSSQYSLFGRTELVEDNNEELVQCFRNVDVAKKIRLIRYNKYGTETMDSVYHDLYDTDSLLFFDNGRLIVDNDDSCYYLYFTYYDELTDEDTGAIWDDGYNGVFFAKLDQNGNFIWQKRLQSPLPLQLAPNYIVNNCVAYSDSSWLLSVYEQKLFPFLQEENQWGKIHYFVYDKNGNELEHNETQDTQWNFGGYGMLFRDSLVVQSNYLSEWRAHPSGQMDWFFRPVLTCRNTDNYEIVWKDTLMPDYELPVDYNIPHELLLNTDTSFVGAYAYFDPHFNPELTEGYSLFPLRFFNKDLRTGEDIWRRNIRYFPEDSMKRYTHQIYDVELTPDGGYILSGYVSALDSLEAGRPGQYGYVLKTNCLGYFGDPQAAFSYTIDGNNVVFTNQSVQAGSYYWDFGDSTGLISSEWDTTIVHPYSESDTFSIQLIAFGCDGAADTLNYSLVFEYTEEEPPDEPIYAGDGTLLTLFPNPVASGNSISFYIGNLEEGENQLEVFNTAGELVDRFKIKAANTTYFYPAKYASGMYFFHLLHNGKTVETEKLVVE